MAHTGYKWLVRPWEEKPQHRGIVGSSDFTTTPLTFEGQLRLFQQKWTPSLPVFMIPGQVQCMEPKKLPESEIYKATSWWLTPALTGPFPLYTPLAELSNYMGSGALRMTWLRHTGPPELTLRWAEDITKASRREFTSSTLFTTGSAIPCVFSLDTHARSAAHGILA